MNAQGTDLHCECGRLMEAHEWAYLCPRCGYGSGDEMYFGLLKIVDRSRNTIFMFWIHSNRNAFYLADFINRSAVGGDVEFSMRLIDNEDVAAKIEWMNGEEWLEV